MKVWGLPRGSKYPIIGYLGLGFRVKGLGFRVKALVFIIGVQVLVEDDR